MGIGLLLFGIFDLIVGTALAAPIWFPESWLFWIGIIVLIKSIISFVGGLATGFLFDFLGWIDLLAGLSLIFGWFIPYLWAIVLVKAAYSIIIGLATMGD